MIEQAIKIVVEHIKKSGSSDQTAIQKLWKDLPLSDTDIRSLAQEGLAVRVGDARRNPGVIPDRPPIRIGNIKFTNTPEVEINVSVRILHDTVYTINGTNKALITFTVNDWNFYIKNERAKVNGIERHIEVATYVRDRLTKLGKKSVKDLAQGELTILAKKWEAITKGLDGKQYDANNIAA